MQSPHNAIPIPGKHRRSEPFTGRHRLTDMRISRAEGHAYLTEARTRLGEAGTRLGRAWIGFSRARLAAAAMAPMLVAAAPAAIADTPDPRDSFESADILAARDDALDAASRSLDRGGARIQAVVAAVGAAAPAVAPRGEAPSAKPQAQPQPEAEPESEPAAEPEPEPEPEPLEAPAPVGGLDQQQMNHATTIVRVGQELGLPEQAYVVALAAALQESYLRVYANWMVPESFDYPYELVGADHDSVGIFQQRPSMGWCSVADCMDPETSARIFYQALVQVPGWESVPVTVAAQAVQGSAFPDYYADDEWLARELVAAILG